MDSFDPDLSVKNKKRISANKIKMQDVVIRERNTNNILSPATFESLTNGLQI